jgi:hypothetical protein
MLDKSWVSTTGRSTEPGDKEAIVIEIADTGPGVSPIDEDRIFQPFERGTTDEPDSTCAHSGMGLGLSIARDIATRHGGTLEVLRTEGEGSCFRFRFPKTETQAQSWMIRATQQAIKDVRPLTLPLGCVLLQLRAAQHGQDDRVYPDPLSAIQLVATQNLRPTDTVLAIEGKLLLLVPACTRAAAHAMIDRVLGYTRETARTFRGPFGEEGVAYGVSAYPEDGETAEAILGRAEAEMRARV